jgi:lipopolysaccharide/colanic/teichoic acid biosynthesis glycosyltransferase
MISNNTTRSEAMHKNIFLQLFLFIVDAFLINAAFLSSFVVRYGLNIPEINFLPYKNNFPFLTFIYMLALIYTRVFKNRFSSYWHLFKRTFNGLLLGTLFSISLLYVFRIIWSDFPSSIFVISFPIALLFIYLFNSRILKLSGRIKKKVIVIGKQKSNGIINKKSLVEEKFIDTIEELLHCEDVDEVIICKQIHDTKQLNLLIYLLLRLKVNVVFNPSIYAELISGNVMNDNSTHFLATFLGRKSDYEEFLIRALDIIGSLVMLIVLSPFIVLTALGIKLTSPGSVLYKQKRIAKDGKTFTLYKFRTMIDNAERDSGPVLAKKNDLRVTKIGRFLRETRIDEIPQLINVIHGEMSLVGPRPERPHFVKCHQSLREIRLAVKPGLTGFAQIRKHYDLHPNHKTKYDVLYIQKRSLLLNLYILFKTIHVVLLRKGQ